MHEQATASQGLTVDHVDTPQCQAAAAAHINGARHDFRVECCPLTAEALDDHVHSTTHVEGRAPEEEDHWE